MTATPRPRFGRATRLLTLALTWLPLAVLAALVAAHLVFFAVRTGHLLRYPFTLDYGEGPLLAQVAELGKGTPIWALYRDPAQPPYLVVNYPPVYLLATWAVSILAPVLLAGRLVSLAATLAATVAIGMLAAWPRSTHIGRWPGLISSWLLALVFAGIPIVREWAALMRVDMLGLALGLWALVVVQRAAGTRHVLWAAPMLALSLLAKPSLVAAPIAAGLWLLFRDGRRAIWLGLLTGALLGLAVFGLQVASGGWFTLHVVTANANTWDARLAFQFWRDQMLIMQPLILAGVLVVAWNVWYGRLAPVQPNGAAFRAPAAVCLLPLYYTLAGLATAFGVG
ncbi:MAG TPA: DUF2029 domain-containing protein, partial [Roseiflexaceae bacterium]|nr:DUF2029 domain-containing protein [Roseiflexaceae bacterium]